MSPTPKACASHGLVYCALCHRHIACKLHGLGDCATCHRRPGQCDYADCQRDAAPGTYAELLYPGEAVCERRPLCAEHAHEAAEGLAGRGIAILGKGPGSGWRVVRPTVRPSAPVKTVEVWVCGECGRRTKRGSLRDCACGASWTARDLVREPAAA